MNISIQTLDIIALIFFFISWISYNQYSQWKSKKKCSLLGVMPRYRKVWMENMEGREHKIFDAAIVGNIMRVLTFFASTTMLIIAAILAGFGSVEKVSAIGANFSFISVSSLAMQEIRFVVLLLIFIYAFFKFTWALRQNNFVLVLIGTSVEQDQESAINNVADKASRLESLAANNFNNGLRAYYFALAVLAWFVHPLLFISATVMIVLVLNRREFHSETLNILSPDKDASD